MQKNRQIGNKTLCYVIDMARFMSYDFRPKLPTVFGQITNHNKLLHNIEKKNVQKDTKILLLFQFIKSDYGPPKVKKSNQILENGPIYLSYKKEEILSGMHNQGLFIHNKMN